MRYTPYGSSKLHSKSPSFQERTYGNSFKHMVYTPFDVLLQTLQVAEFNITLSLESGKKWMGVNAALGLNPIIDKLG